MRQFLRMFLFYGACSIVSLGFGQRSVLAIDPTTAPKDAELKALLDKAYDALQAKQNPDGSFAPKLGGPGITALTAAALIRSGRSAEDPVVAKALKYLEKAVKKDGGVYDKGLANYTTCLAIVTFKEANTKGRYDKVIENASKFVRTLQYGDADPKDLKFGGTGYDGKSRPDLSNTQFFLEALVASGAKSDDPAIKKAIAFISRSQNLPSEFNDQEYATKASEDDKGGFVYNPLDAGDEKSSKRTAAGGLRSEGGMTYAGLKSFLYAGVSKEDPRVKAAVLWVKRNYTLENNPGMGKAGLFYYYHTFAKAMAALGQDNFEDAKGVKHPWRLELFQKLKATQNADGSWTNSDRAFLENTPELATAFAVLSLSYCK